jgi:DNA invertase Pin-like site-specific DNA recombinase
MSKVTLRCAIYTRKSSEEGLEQGFNSLDAQREACEAFVLSQQHEGWKAIPTMYDDGGYSGGNIERPALKQLLIDIDQKKVNVVVVYKVDRLTRSLADFAKIVELFDAKGISFVSVTQQFNTTSSMGRLTLNVLLSFAQFEREVTGERIRDKIAASKQKGMWMGGTAPIGYVGHERTLVIDEAHVALIRSLYERYLVLGSIRALKMDLDAQHIFAPLRYRVSGNVFGGKPFSRGNLQRILTNPVYTGKMVHFTKVFLGQHPAIIDQALWDAVQAKIAGNKQNHEQRPKAASDSLLSGIIYDSDGQRLSPSHSQKQSKRFRYYISLALVNNSAVATKQGLRLPAQELEHLVIKSIRDWLSDSAAILNALNHQPEQVHNILISAQKLVVELNGHSGQQYYVIRQLVERVTVSAGSVEILLRKACLLADPLKAEKKSSKSSRASGESDTTIMLKVSVQLKRCGYAMRLIVTDLNNKQVLRDHRLIANISKAHQWLALLTSGKVTSVKEIAASEKVDPTHVTRMLHRAFLAPDIVRAILNGTQPVHFDLKYLKQFRALPIDWTEQRKLLGF